MRMFASTCPLDGAALRRVGRDAWRVQRVQQVRRGRDGARFKAALEAVRGAAESSDNLVPSIVDAVEAQATVGEIADAMRTVFGEYKEVSFD